MAGIRIDTPQGAGWEYSLDTLTWQTGRIFTSQPGGAAFVLDAVYTVYCRNLLDNTITQASIVFGLPDNLPSFLGLLKKATTDQRNEVLRMLLDAAQTDAATKTKFCELVASCELAPGPGPTGGIVILGQYEEVPAVIVSSLVYAVALAEDWDGPPPPGPHIVQYRLDASAGIAEGSSGEGHITARYSDNSEQPYTGPGIFYIITPYPNGMTVTNPGNGTTIISLPSGSITANLTRTLAFSFPENMNLNPITQDILLINNSAAAPDYSGYQHSNDFSYDFFDEEGNPSPGYILYGSNWQWNGQLGSLKQTGTTGALSIALYTGNESQTSYNADLALARIKINTLPIGVPDMVIGVGLRHNVAGDSGVAAWMYDNSSLTQVRRGIGFGPFVNFTWQAGLTYWLKYQYEETGVDTQTSRVKVWAENQDEPGAWMNVWEGQPRHNGYPAIYGGANGATLDVLDWADTVIGPNYASAANFGASATASSTDTSNGLTAAHAIDGDRKGGAVNAFSWWQSQVNAVSPSYTVDLKRLRVLSSLVLFSVQDNYENSAEPTDSMTFSLYGLTAFDIQVPTRVGGWRTIASVTGNNLVKRKVTFPPEETQFIRVVCITSPDAYKRIAELEVYGEELNFATQRANPSSASASNTLEGTSPLSAINGNRSGSAGYWNSQVNQAVGATFTIDLGLERSFQQVIVYSVQDNAGNPVEPTELLTFTQYGLVGFTVQTSPDAATWTTRATVANNTQVKRAVSFARVSARFVRIVVDAIVSGDAYARIVEVDVLGSDPNVARSIHGSTATASSTLDNALYGPQFVLSGEKIPANWNTPPAGWNSAVVPGAANEWLNIDFGQVRNIQRVVLYMLPGDFGGRYTPITDTETSSNYALRDFRIQAPNTSGGWDTLATVTANTNNKRTIEFTSRATRVIRVQVDSLQSSDSYARLLEFEAFETPSAVTTLIDP